MRTIPQGFLSCGTTLYAQTNLGRPNRESPRHFRPAVVNIPALFNNNVGYKDAGIQTKLLVAEQQARLTNTVTRHNTMKSVSVAIVLLFSALASEAAKPKHFLFVPKSAAEPMPVAVWLHGYRGYSPDGYFPGETAEAMQKHADALGAIIIGFPATTELGDETQQWSEEPVADHAYIQDRLRSLTKGMKVDLKRVGLFGFSQGAMVAADLASLYPDSYRGAILMSPGGMGSPKASRQKLPAHSLQVYFCFCGAQEHEGNVGLTNVYAILLEKVLGARVTTKRYEGVSKHTRPPDFMAQFPTWMGAILNNDEKH